MCIMMTEEEPSSTRLFNIPVFLDSKKHTMLIYTNDLTLKEKNNGSALMIVAIPNISNTDTFGLVDISTKKMKTFRQFIIDTCKPSVYAMANGQGMYWSDGIKSQLKVNVVGNYDISVAPNLDALQNQINWNHFSLPNDFKTRLDTLSDPKLFPFNCAFVVAQANKHIKNDGFGVIYENFTGFTYLPTCHENKGNNDWSKSFYHYDVQIYNFSNKIQKELEFGERTYGMDNYQIDSSFVNMFDNVCIMSKDGTQKKYNVDGNSNIIYHIEFKGSQPTNQNIIY